MRNMLRKWDDWKDESGLKSLSFHSLSYLLCNQRCCIETVGAYPSSHLDKGRKIPLGRTPVHCKANTAFTHTPTVMGKPIQTMVIELRGHWSHQILNCSLDPLAVCQQCFSSNPHVALHDVTCVNVERWTPVWDRHAMYLWGWMFWKILQMVFMLEGTSFLSACVCLSKSQICGFCACQHGNASDDEANLEVHSWSQDTS